MPYLRIARNGEPQGEVELTGDVVGIGRDPGNDIPLVDPDKWVSRFHAEIHHDEHGYSVVDLGTTNGLTVDGEAINEAVLVDGTQIAIGPFTLEFRLSRAADPVPALAPVAPPVPAAPPPAAPPSAPPSASSTPSPPPAVRSPAAVPASSGATAARGGRRIRWPWLFVVGVVLVLAGVGAVVLTRRTAPPSAAVPSDVRPPDPPPSPDPPIAHDPTSPLLAEARLRYENADLAGAEDKVNEILLIDVAHAQALVLQGEIAAKRRELAGPTGTRRGGALAIRQRPDVPVRGDDTQASYDTRANEIADIVREIDQSLAQRQPQRALEGAIRLRRLEAAYARTDQYQMEARRSLVEEALAEADRARLRWSSVETSLQRAGQSAGGLESLTRIIEQKRRQLLANNRTEATELLGIGNQHLASNKKAEAMPLLEQITRMLPASDPLHVQALDFLRTIR